MEISVCGQLFKLEKIVTKLGDGTSEIKFTTHIGDKVIELKGRYGDDMVNDFAMLQGLDGTKELERFMAYEARLEIYEFIRQTTIKDISLGKRIDLLPEFVREFGVGYIDLEVQELHSEIILEAMSHYGEQINETNTSSY